MRIRVGGIYECRDPNRIGHVLWKMLDGGKHCYLVEYADAQQDGSNHYAPHTVDQRGFIFDEDIPCALDLMRFLNEIEGDTIQ